MTVDDAVRYLRRYRTWRRNPNGRTMVEAGFDSGTVGDAMDLVIHDRVVLLQGIKSVKARLARCIVSRARIHAELRRMPKV